MAKKDLCDRPSSTLSETTLSRRAFLQRSATLGAGVGLLAACASSSRPRRSPLLAVGEPLVAEANTSDGELSLGNSAIRASWQLQGDSLRAGRVVDLLSRSALPLPVDVFTLTLADGRSLGSSAMRVVGGARTQTLEARPAAARAAERQKGKQISLTLRDDAGRVEATWRAILRDGSRYLRQEVTLVAMGEALPLRAITLLDLSAVDRARVAGSVSGTPVVAGEWYMGMEHPLSASIVDGVRVRCSLPRELPIRPGAPITVSSVIGAARAGQLRRDFLGYLERERAHPYRPFLHYNSWYDLGYFSKFSEPEALAVIETFGTELVRKRGVALSSFLFDDGWDDPRTLWGFHSGFPNGFSALRDAARRYDTAPGVWMSPWGGYGKPKEERLAFGRAQGFETNAGGFALSGPRYYERFRDTCLRMVREYGVNQFKFDGTGNASSAFPGSLFDSDFDAAIHLIDELRTERPELFVNLTTGTYPSPFWLRHADSIWRGGEDHDFAGVGSDRQRWITYRDGDTHHNVVKRGELYPLNSLMLHGLIYARHANKLNVDPHGDFDAEVRSYFGSGTQLQEMYITPTLQRSEWDAIAESARWSRRNASTLVDTHWVGGDPLALEPYGWASWSADGGLLTLRNPADRVQRLPVDPERIFELPPGAARSFLARSPWARDRTRLPVMLRAGEEHVIELGPFQVLTLEAMAR
ncbi:MAG: enterotoxin [Gemmatimonadota bacterium]|nr:enterotoxin [Gemmatimonadota bacterium]